MFVDSNAKITILSALNLSWNRNDILVKGRPFHALSIRLKGDGKITNGNKTEQLSTGSILFVPQGADYYINTNSEQLFVIHFLADDIDDSCIKVFNPKNIEPFFDLFTRFYHAYSTKTLGYELKCLSLFYEILYLLEKTNDVQTSPDYKKLKKAIDYIHLNFTNPELSIKELCKLAYFSDTYFRKLFFSIFNTTPLNYLNNLRLNHAKALLLETNYSVSHVALLSGFYDDKYFRKLFKKKFDLRPTQFRNK